MTLCKECLGESDVVCDRCDKRLDIICPDCKQRVKEAIEFWTNVNGIIKSPKALLEELGLK